MLFKPLMWCRRRETVRSKTNRVWEGLWSWTINIKHICMRSRELHNQYNYRCSSWTDPCFPNSIYNSIQMSIRLVIKGILQKRLRNAFRRHMGRTWRPNIYRCRWENTGDWEATVEVLLNATMQMIRKTCIIEIIYHILYLHYMLESQISWTLERHLGMQHYMMMTNLTTLSLPILLLKSSNPISLWWWLLVWNLAKTT